MDKNKAKARIDSLRSEIKYYEQLGLLDKFNDRIADAELEIAQLEKMLAQN